MIVASTAIDTSFVARQSPEVTTVELDGEAVLYDERTHMAHVLNGTAAVVWSCLDGSASLAELIADLAEAYGVSSDVIEEDVLALTRRLGAQGLLDGVADEPLPDDAPAADKGTDDCADD